MKHCPRCQSTHFVKNGCVNEKQRYKCKNCEYQFTRTTPRGHPPEHKKLTVLLYCHGISMNAISKLFHVSSNAALKWIRTFAKKQAPKPTLAPELPSFWNLMRCGIISKIRKTNSGYGKHLIETPDTSLIGNAGIATKKHLRNSQHASLPSMLRYIIRTNGRSMKPYYLLQNMFRPKQKHIALNATTA